MNRAEVIAAVRDRLQTVEGVMTVATRWKPAAQFAPEQQPVLIVVPDNQSAEHRARGLPPLWTLRATVCLYVYEDSEAGPSATLLGLCDAVEAALQIQPGEQVNDPSWGTTLDGKCWGVQVTGIEIGGSDLGEQAAAFIDLEILVPGTM